MRVGIDAREAFRPEPRGIGLYTRHLLREFAALGTTGADEYLLYHQLPMPACGLPMPAIFEARLVRFLRQA